MKSNSQKLVIVLLVAAILLLLAIFYLASRSFRPTELLVAWGWQGDMPGQNCILQVINPQNQMLGPVHSKDENCNYQLTNIKGQPRLVGEQKDPRAIVIYSITSTDDLVIEKTIPVEGATVVLGALRPQFGDDGSIYFTGVLNSDTGIMQDRMQLLRLDPQTEEVVSFVAYEEGMIDFPSLSPDGTQLIYSAFPGLKTWADCRSSCASYYHLLNLETNTYIDLTSLVNQLGANPVFSHCGLQWSPDGRFIAFNLGCESESPGYVIIFNAEKNEVVTVVKPIEVTSNANVVGWLSDDEIVYGQNVSKEGYGSRRFYRYFIYSLSSGSSNELTALPLTNSEGLGLVMRDVNWTPNGRYLTAVESRGDGESPLLVMRIGPEESQISYLAQDTINERPLWSPTGNWIVYTSFEDIDAWYEGRNIVKITDRDGKTIIDTDVANIASRYVLGYAWLRP